MADTPPTPPSSTDSPTGEDAWLTTEEAAEEFGFHRETLRRWIREGIIPASRAPGRRRWTVRRGDVRQALEDRAREQAPAPDPARSRIETAGERTIVVGR